MKSEGPRSTATAKFPTPLPLAKDKENEHLLKEMLKVLEKHECLKTPFWEGQRSPWSKAFVDLHHPTGPWGSKYFCNTPDMENRKQRGHFSQKVKKIHGYLKDLIEKLDEDDSNSDNSNGDENDRVEEENIQRVVFDKLDSFYEKKEYYKSLEELIKPQLLKPVSERIPREEIKAFFDNFERFKEEKKRSVEKAQNIIYIDCDEEDDDDVREVVSSEKEPNISTTSKDKVAVDLDTGTEKDINNEKEETEPELNKETETDLGANENNHHESFTPSSPVPDPGETLGESVQINNTSVSPSETLNDQFGTLFSDNFMAGEAYLDSSTPIGESNNINNVANDNSMNTVKDTAAADTATNNEAAVTDTRTTSVVDEDTVEKIMTHLEMMNERNRKDMKRLMYGFEDLVLQKLNEINNRINQLEKLYCGKVENALSRMSMLEVKNNEENKEERIISNSVSAQLEKYFKDFLENVVQRDVNKCLEENMRKTQQVLSILSQYNNSNNNAMNHSQNSNIISNKRNISIESNNNQRESDERLESTLISPPHIHRNHSRQDNNIILDDVHKNPNNDDDSNQEDLSYYTRSPSIKYQNKTPFKRPLSDKTLRRSVSGSNSNSNSGYTYNRTSSLDLQRQRNGQRQRKEQQRGHLDFSSPKDSKNFDGRHYQRGNQIRGSSGSDRGLNNVKNDDAHRKFQAGQSSFAREKNDHNDNSRYKDQQPRNSEGFKINIDAMNRSNNGSNLLFHGSGYRMKKRRISND